MLFRRKPDKISYELEELVHSLKLRILECEKRTDLLESTIKSLRVRISRLRGEGELVENDDIQNQKDYKFNLTPFG